MSVDFSKLSYTEQNQVGYSLVKKITSDVSVTKGLFGRTYHVNFLKNTGETKTAKLSETEALKCMGQWAIQNKLDGPTDFKATLRQLPTTEKVKNTLKTKLKEATDSVKGWFTPKTKTEPPKEEMIETKFVHREIPIRQRSPSRTFTSAEEIIGEMQKYQTENGAEYKEAYFDHPPTTIIVGGANELVPFELKFKLDRAITDSFKRAEILDKIDEWIGMSRG